MTDTNATQPETPAVWTLDEMLAHAAAHPDATDVRRRVVREGRLAADDAHRGELLRQREAARPLTPDDVRTMDEEAFAELRRSRRRGGFQW